MKFAKWGGGRGGNPPKAAQHLFPAWFLGERCHGGDAMQLLWPLPNGGPGLAPSTLPVAALSPVPSRGAPATNTQANGPSRHQNAFPPWQEGAARADGGHPTRLGVRGVGGDGAVATGTGRDRLESPTATAAAR